MSFTKFFDLVTTSELFMTRVDNLSNDPYEATISARRYDPNLLMKVHLPDENDPSKQRKVLMTQKEAMGERFEDITKIMKEGDEKMRSSFFVNCWRRSKHESEMGWNSYAGSDSVAIKTTVKKLEESITSSPNLFFGNVKYFDPETEENPAETNFNAVYHKRIQFEHEAESRIFFLDVDGISKPVNTRMTNHRIKVDLPNLIQEVWISPKDSGLLEKSVNRVLSDSHLNPIIKKSKILSRN